MRVDQPTQSRLHRRSILASFGIPLKGWVFRRETGFVALMLALTLVRGVIYAALVLPWQASDEPYHVLSALSILAQESSDPQQEWSQTQTKMTASLLQYRWWDFVVFVPAVRTIEEARRNLPNGLDKPNLINPRAFTYYGLAQALRLLQHQEPGLQLYWIRFLSSIINLGIVGLAFAMGRALFGAEPLSAWLVPLIVMFMPANTFMMATANDGNPAELFVSLAIFFLVLGLIKDQRWYHLVGMAVFGVLAAMAKPTTYFFIPILVAALLVWIWKRLPKWGRIGALPIALVCGYIIWATSTRLQLYVHRLFSILSSVQAATFIADLQTLPLERDILWIIGRLWADLGWHTLVVSDNWAIAFTVLTLLAVAGLIKLGISSWRRGANSSSLMSIRRVAGVFVLCVVLNLAVITIGSAYYGVSYFTTRYMLGAILPIAGLLVIGWRELLPTSWRQEGMAVLVSFLFLFDTVTLLWYVVPFFYPLWR